MSRSRRDAIKQKRALRALTRLVYAEPELAVAFVKAIERTWDEAFAAEMARGLPTYERIVPGPIA